MSVQQAIAEETFRYVHSIEAAIEHPNSREGFMHKAHIHALALARLRGMSSVVLAFTR